MFYWQQLVTLCLQHLVWLRCAYLQQHFKQRSVGNVSVIAVERLLGHYVHVYKVK